MRYASRRSCSAALYNSRHLSTVQVRACICFLVGYNLNLYACLATFPLQPLIFLFNQTVECFLHTLLRHRSDDLEKRMSLFQDADSDSNLLIHVRIVSLCILVVKSSTPPYSKQGTRLISLLLKQRVLRRGLIKCAFFDCRIIITGVYMAYLQCCTRQVGSP